MAKPPAEDCYDKAVELLSRRAHFRRQLATKLSDRGFGADEIDATLEALTQRGLIADDRFARELAAGPLRRKGFGPRRIRAELLRRGVDEALAASVAREVFGSIDDELEAAREAARRKRRARPMSKEALARHLDRKGYSQHVVLQVVSEADCD